MASMANRAVISSGSSAYKLELYINGKHDSIIWEHAHGVILETRFNNDGAITMQRYIKPANGDILDEIKSILKSNSITDVMHSDYSDVKLDKACPKCGAHRLKRYSSASLATDGAVPVMPIYICEACGTKSYYLTDEYLEYMVYGNANLFTEDERKELDTNKKAFLEELKAYIIRIFASKKIMCIKS